MIHSSVETWGNNKIAEALLETHATKGSYLAYAIFELGVEFAATNLCVFEYAGRSITHIVLSPLFEDYKFITGLNYLVEGLWKTVVAVLFDHFIVFVALARLLTLDGNKTRPFFNGANDAYRSQFLHSPLIYSS